MQLNVDMTTTAEDIFLKVVELPPAERQLAVQRACGSDRAKSDRVWRMLELSQSDRLDFLDHPPIADPVDRIHSGDRIGAYRLLRSLGSGASGVVFEAEQDSPERRVALKLLRWGELSPRATDLFRAEGNLLGRLTHPGIAAVYESGVHTMDDGWSQPFIAMELVEGSPLDEYVQSRHLDVQRFISVMIEVCDAVRHAHERGVIHGDLKPANILVAENGTAKIIDFGIGRTSEEDDGRGAGFSASGYGTLSFMSPERLSGKSTGADPRSDVYSLGVVMYYTLTGKMPPTSSPIKRDRWLDPSARSNLSIHIPRGSRLNDLGAILAKALASDRAARYQTVADLSQDLRRLLSLRPVIARRGPLLWRASLFARRNPALAATSALAACIACTGVVAVSVGYAQAVASDRQARGALADANAISGALREVIIGGQYRKTEGQVLLSDLLIHGEDIAENLVDVSPNLIADFYLTLALGYDSISLSERALWCVERGIKQIDEADTPDHATQTDLAHLRGASLRALGLPREALESHESLLRKLKAEGATRTLVRRSEVAVGLAHQQLGNYERAEQVFRPVIEELRREVGVQSSDTLAVMSNLAQTLQSAGRAHDAIDFAEIVHRNSAAAWGPQDQRVIATGNTLAWCYVAAGRVEDAEQLLAGLLVQIIQVFGADSPELPKTAFSLAHLYLTTEDYAAMFAVLAEHLPGARAHFPPASFTLGSYEGLYGLALLKTGRAEDAIPVLEASCFALEASLGLGHQTTAEAVKALVAAYQHVGDEEAAARWQDRLPTSDE